MEEPKRVLHVIQRMEAAGSQTLLMNLYRNIDRSRLQFDFLVHYKEKQFFDSEIEELGGKVYRLSVREDYNFVKYYSQLNKFFQEHDEYKVVHGHMHSLGAVYLNCAKRRGVPVRIAHSHSNSSARNMKRYIKEIMINLYKKNANYLFACSKDAGKYMFGDSEFSVINNAIDSEKFIFNSDIRNKLREELNIKNKFVLGHVGRFEIPKNHNFLIEVFSEYCKMNNDAVLLLIGTGSLEEKIREKVNKLELAGKVIFLGNRRDVEQLYQAMDVFLFPSLFEGLGIVAVEAQAAGLPCICSENLPNEINLSTLFHPISLKDSISMWTKKIKIESESNKQRIDMSDSIKKAGYDIKYLAREMENFYLSKY